MKWTLPASLLVATVAAGMPAPAMSDAGSITKTEIRSDPPAVTDRRLRDMIWDMFQQQDLRTRDAPRAQLSRLWFQTRPVGTSVQNLCRYDSAVVEFAPARHGSTHDADTPVRPIGLTATSYFHFIAPPPDQDSDDTGSRHIVSTDGPCASLDTRKTGFFAADNPESALEGYRAFIKLQQAIREKTLLPLDCDLFPAENSCSDVIMALTPDDIGSIEQCDAERDQYCAKVYAGDREIRIVLNRATSEQPQERPIRAKLESLIIIADRLID